jgi:hypothetical protein
MQIRQYSMGVLLILVLLLPQFLGHIFSFVIDQWSRLL